MGFLGRDLRPCRSSVEGRVNTADSKSTYFNNPAKVSKSSTGVAIRNPHRAATACVKCFVL